MLPILWGLMINVQAQGRLAESLLWGQEMLPDDKGIPCTDVGKRVSQAFAFSLFA